MKKSGIVMILSTASAEQAPVIAEELVASGLAACVNILPVQSVYRWRGKICKEGESLMIIKTREENTGSAINGIKKLHAYEVPEITVLPVIGGHAPYIDWIIRGTGHPG